MRIDLVGPIPPPYGGVSVHVERLAERLRTTEHTVEIHSPQLRSEWVWGGARRIHREASGDILHFHTMGAFEKLAQGALAVLGHRVVLTVHGQGMENELMAGSRMRRAVVGAALRRLHGLVAVNGRIRRFALEQVGLRPERVFEVPAFLPPDRARLLNSSPGPDIEAFLRAHTPVLAANAFDLRLYHGIPLYGADLLPDLLTRVRERHPQAGALLYLGSSPASDAPALGTLQERVRSLGLQDHCRVVVGSRPFGPALARASVMIRPTATDGDAVSVREALFLGLPVIASDVAVRPEGTITVKGRDPDALARATLDVLANQGAAQERVAASRPRDTFADLLAVYRAVMDMNP